MTVRTVEFNDHKYSEEVLKLTLDNTSINSSNRYKNKYNLTTKDGTYTRMLQIEDLVAESRPTDTYITVPVELQYDPYRLALQFYEDKDLYWVILGANRLTDPFELEEGMTIRIPDLQSIYGLNGLQMMVDE